MPTTSDPSPLFASPTGSWQQISPRWKTVDRIANTIGCLVFSTVPAVLVGAITGLWWISALIWGSFLVLWAILWFVTGRQWVNYGYAELADDLYVARGMIFRRLTIVPYGRMQVVDVTSGPLERAFGLATVKMVTASASSDATIPGLPAEEATRLRDQLSQRAEERLSGL